MNRRKALALLLAAPLVPYRALATPESTPALPPSLSPLISPLATSATETTYRRDNDATRDAVRFRYLVFTFASEDDALQGYDDVLANIEAAREDDSDFASNWHDEISIGKVGTDRIGYEQENGERIYGLAVQDEIMVHFSVVTPRPVDEYTEWLQPILEDSPSLDLTLADFPSGWRYEREPRDVSDYFI